MGAFDDVPFVEGKKGGGTFDDVPMVRNPVRRSDGMAQAFGQGVTLGAGDELAASVRAAMPGFSDWMMAPSTFEKSLGKTGQTVSTAPTYDQRYDEELNRERTKSKAFAESNPVLSTGSNIAGTVTGGLALSALPGVGTLFRGGAGLVRNVLKGAAGGALVGGAQGFGEGEGGFDNRMRGATTGAVVGGAVGGALPGVAKGASILYEKAAPRVLNRLADVADKYAPKVTPNSLSAAAPEGGQVAGDGFLTRLADAARSGAGNIEEDAAIRRLAQAVSSDGGVGRARNELATLGEDAFVADTGRGAERLATVGKLTSNDAANKYSTAYTNRNARTGERFINAMGEDANVPSIYDARRFLDANRSHVGATAYGAMDEAGLKQTPRLMQMYENPEVKAAIDSVMLKEKGSRVGMSRTPASPVEIMHEVKRAIQNIGMDPNGRPAPGASWWQDASNEFVRELKRANPALAEADTAYREAVSLYNKRTGEGWLTRGQNFLRSGQSDAGVAASNAALHDELPRATADQLRALRVGAANTMRDTALDGAKSTRRLADSIVESDAKQSKLVRIFDQETAGNILGRSRAELRYAAGNSRVNAGSETADRAANLVRETALSAPPASGGDILGIWRSIKDVMAKTDAASEPVRARLADLLANPSPAANAEALSLVEAFLARQARPRLSPGVAGAAGGGFSEPNPLRER